VTSDLAAAPANPGVAAFFRECAARQATTVLQRPRPNRTLREVAGSCALPALVVLCFQPMTAK